MIKAGSISNLISTFQDVMPTLAEITGADTPDDISGISFFPELLGKKQKEYEYLYWEFPESTGQMAVRKGNMKAIRKNMHKGNLSWEVYNIETDPEETKDISSSQTEFIMEVEEIVAREHTASPNTSWRYKVLGE
jgi:arylsulfatase